MLTETAKKAIDAYGGQELWINSGHIEAEVSVKGLAFTLKRRPFFEKVKISMEIHRPKSRLIPIGKMKETAGVLDGMNSLLEDSSGKLIEERKNARDFFTFGRRLLYWDDLDMAYFANYAFWNYFTLPALLMNQAIKWTEKRAGLLEAEFPESIPSHSRFQEFHFDISTGRLIQHNYTADIISKLATAANTVKEHSEQNGFVYPSRRIVTPRNFNGRPLPFPILIDITVHQFVLLPRCNT
ncbi:MAG TPA: hypothetical protein PL048_12435 [Leptospiraceae bacterium]|nr:hypothetical protein [Leptospiraceae bacterium]HMY65042.1 hypothetical protein [Leptospiraceae bacterium]HMZ59580.1 hypothetical protein [Leptospiraceae bacterium]HNF22865.1 hypothetical protein [Leptospiraceae bacterium]HNI95624.1 hypothetical protein [Leptospiraceae bacterium]